MKQERTRWGYLLACASVPAIALALVGCTTTGGKVIPEPPVVTAASVTTPTGVLVANQANRVTVTATVVDLTATVQAVTADLSQIGGPVSQPLVFDGATNTWSTTLAVTPTVSGVQQVTVTATDGNLLTGEATDSVIVTTSGFSVPPVITNPTAIGSFVAGFVSQLVASVTVTDVQGTVQGVTVDLTEIGGLPDQPLQQTGQDPSLWVFSGPVTPPDTGTFVIIFSATDNLGGVGTASTVVAVNAPLP
jgi:hypothetical protein